MKKTKVFKTIIIICLVLLAGIGIASGIYLKQQWDRTTYFEHTSINGHDASGKTPKEILTLLTKEYSAPQIQLNENGAEELKGSLSEFGYEVDGMALLDELESALGAQKTSIPVLIESLMNGNSFQVTVSFTCDETKLAAKVNSAALKDARVTSVDSVMEFDADAKNYYLTQEVYGTEMDDAALQALVKEQVDALTSAKDPQQDLIIDIPSELYFKPAVTQDDVELNNLCNLYNQYDKAKITYDFGEEKEVIDWNTIQNWLTVADGAATLNETLIYEYVEQMAAKYNTIYYERTFHTSLGTDVTIPGTENEYGYLLDQDGEFSQLLADIKANVEVEREPVYSYSGYKRNGTDDLAGTYVEVNLSTQHLWFYVDGQLIVESDIVSGNVAKGTETQTGAFPLAYKESPSVLTGGNAENGYSTPVTYWMPFFDGQGLHDANWRESFGGNIYQSSGSHGCVNLPPATAEKIYNSIDAGVAIILYK